MSRPNFPSSRAVLIGVADYLPAAKLDALPSVRDSTIDLADILIDPLVCGFPTENVKLKLNPQSSDEVFELVAKASAETEDLLLFYYAGHGKLHGRARELYLSQSTSVSERPWTFLQFGHVFEQIRESRASVKVIILDCCFSGRALRDTMANGSEAEQVINQLGAEGISVIASSAENRVSMSPQGERYTAFTGQLIRTLRGEGIKSRMEYLTVLDVFTSVRASLQRQNMPLPQANFEQTASLLEIARNVTHIRYALPVAPQQGFEQELYTTSSWAEEAVRIIVNAVLDDSAHDLLLASLRTHLLASFSRESTEVVMWGQVLAVLPHDPVELSQRFFVSFEMLTQKLAAWCLSFRKYESSVQVEYEKVHAGLCALLLTLIGIKESWGLRQAVGILGGSPRTLELRADLESETVFGTLLLDEAVSGFLLALYHPKTVTSVFRLPDEPSEPWGSSTSWGAAGMTFLRHGTTSFLVKLRYPDGDRRGGSMIVAKFVLYPYVRVPFIADSTRLYSERYGPKQGLIPKTPAIMASTSAAVLMEFVPGVRLDELLERRRNARAGAVAAKKLDLEALRTLGVAVFDCLIERSLDLARFEGHGDLCPSNVIVQEFAKRQSVEIVDFGVNYLHSGLIGSQGSESAYAAPEIRRSGLNTSVADYYSLAQLIIAIAGKDPTNDGFVPDEFYLLAPGLARFIEDLIDSNPNRRLMIYAGVDGWSSRAERPGLPYESLRSAFDTELQTAAVSETEPTVKRRILSWLIPELNASSRSTASRMLQIRGWQQKAELEPNPVRDHRLTVLEWWRLIAWSSYAFAAVLCTIWLARDFDVRLLPESIAKVLPGMAGFASTAQDWPAQVALISSLLTVQRIHQTVWIQFAPTLGPQVVPRLRRWALFACVTVVSMIFIPSILLSMVVLVNVALWPFALAGGLTAAFLCNLACITFLLRTVEAARARGLAAFPSDDHEIAGLAILRSWTTTSLFYAVLAWVFALLVYRGVLHDVYLYGLLVGVASLFVICVLEVSRRGLMVQATVNRAIVASERLRESETVKVF